MFIIGITWISGVPFVNQEETQQYILGIPNKVQ